MIPGRWTRTLLLVAAGTLVLHGAVWAYATAGLRTEVLVTLDGLRQQGWTIEAGPPRWTGWPLSGALDMPVAVDGAGAGVPVAWRADSVRVGLSALQPGTLRITPSSPQRIRFGQGPWLTLTAASLDLAASGGQVDMAGQDLVLAYAGGTVEAAGVQGHAAGLGMQAALTGVRAASVPGVPAPARLWLDASLTQPLPAGPDAAAQVTAWRDAGGVIAVHGVLVEAGALAASGTGTIRLDARLQPEMDLMTQVRGWRPAVDGLVQAGAVTRGSGVAAKAMLSMLSGPDAAELATVPLRIGEGVLKVGNFPLARVPALDWTPAQR